MATFRDSILAIAPPWLKGRVGGTILYVTGTMVDALGDWLRHGIYARFPDTAPPDAIGYIGNDRGIDRGPSEESSSYRPRLRQAAVTWKNAGGGRTVLTQIAAYLTGIADPPMRLVSDDAVWHNYNWGTGVATKTIVGTNWTWDGFTGVRWWRGWVIIDSTLGPFGPPELWGDAGDLWGTSGDKWGIKEPTSAKVVDIIRVIKKWKPANVDVMMIACFNNSIFLSSNASPPNPSGNYGVFANRDTRAVYIRVGT